MRPKRCYWERAFFVGENLFSPSAVSLNFLNIFGYAEMQEQAFAYPGIKKPQASGLRAYSVILHYARCLGGFDAYFTFQLMLSPARIGTNSSPPKGRVAGTVHDSFTKVIVSLLRGWP